MKLISLSASKLNILRECPRCFYDANALKIARPRGIFPSLPGGMDLALKKFMSQYRGSLPPMLRGDVGDCILMPDEATLEKWRNWRTGLVYTDKLLGVKLIGALDDCLINRTGEDTIYTPLDFKTKGSEPKTDGSEYYQGQLDCYDLLLRSNGYQTAKKGYLCYIWPDAFQGEDAKNACNFGSRVYELTAESDRAMLVIKDAVELITGGKRPEPSPTCEYCNFAMAYNG